MKVKITHSCGHTVEHNLVGPSKQRDGKERWLRERPCWRCARLEEHKRNIKDTSHLPPLVGTEKQIAWATDIRAEWLRTAERLILEAKRLVQRGKDKPETVERLENAINEVLSNQDASWWIDHRNDDIRYHVLSLM